MVVAALLFTGSVASDAYKIILLLMVVASLAQS